MTLQIHSCNGQVFQQSKFCEFPDTYVQSFVERIEQLDMTILYSNYQISISWNGVETKVSFKKDKVPFFPLLRIRQDKAILSNEMNFLPSKPLIIHVSK